MFFYNLRRSFLDKAERKLLAEFIYESDAIEGIRDDIELLERQIVDGKFNGHAGAMLLLETLARSETDWFGEEEFVCLIQLLITAEQHLKPGGEKLPDKFIGRYRTVNVLIGGRKCPDHKLIPALMSVLLEEIRKWQKSVKNDSSRHNICTVADFHFIFETIYPFADGNGRTGRALVWYLFRRAGIKPFIFTAHDRHETYYRCFEKPVDMRRYFMRKMGLPVCTA